jgi:ABC-type dipeptide/oligopeptide/nickel transport system permease subunit
MSLILTHARSLFHRLVLQRAGTCFFVMGLSFLGFGIGTVNLASLLKANLDLVLNYGWSALIDGAALQLLELLSNAYLAMAFYVVFKACEHRLVHGLSAGPH